MNIIEAVEESLKSEKYFTRIEMQDVYKLKATNDGSAHILVIALYRLPAVKYPNWNPSAEDILATDWVLVD